MPFNLPLKKSHCGRPSSVSPTGCQLPPREALVVAEAGAIQRGTIEMATLRSGRLPPPTQAKAFGGFLSTGSSGPVRCGRLISAPTGGCFPFTAPFQKILLRQALFSQPYGLPASPKGSFGGSGSCSHLTNCYQSGNVAGRQIADPYGLSNFWRIPLNALLSKPAGCGRLVSAPTGWRFVGDCPHSPILYIVYQPIRCIAILFFVSRIFLRRGGALAFWAGGGYNG